jgi:putative isomerase
MKISTGLMVSVLLGALCCNAQTRQDNFDTSGEAPRGELARFANLLNAKGVPDGSSKTVPDLFFDLGAWQGFGLPAGQDVQHRGGFTGPFALVDQRGWVSPELVHLSLKRLENGHEIVLGETTSSTKAYYPGFLAETYDAGDVSVAMRLWFLSSRSAMVSSRISNKSTHKIVLDVGWDGSVDGAGYQIVAHGAGIQVDLPQTTGLAEVTFSKEFGPVELNSTDRQSYAVRSEPTTLQPGESTDRYAVESIYWGEADRANDVASIQQALADPERSFSRSQERWAGYIMPLLRRVAQTPDHEMREAILVKSIETLIAEWRSPAGGLTFDGFFPSWQTFQGFWAWDSWKHAAALSLFAPDLAKNQVRAMFAYQDDAGMVPDKIGVDQRQNNLRDTKPPLAAWAVWKIYLATKDESFLREMYPKLVRYHKWWYAKRDHDHNGLCEYGSTDGTVVAARWESGMDNAARFDDVKMLRNDDGAFSLDQESVDLNSYLYAEKLYLADISEVLKQHEESARWRNDAELLRARIRQRMFDPETGYFYDARVGDGQIHVQGPEGWVPLWTGVASQEQATAVRKIMANPNKFATPLPFPTLAADNPHFDPTGGYWRGPVWLDQVYFAIAGLKAYGFEEDANKFEQQIYLRTGAATKGVAIRENYSPTTGVGLNAKDFGWSAASLLMMSVGDFNNGLNRLPESSSTDRGTAKP